MTGMKINAAHVGEEVTRSHPVLRDTTETCAHEHRKEDNQTLRQKQR